MVSLLSSRQLANEVFEDRLLRIARGRKMPWVAFYGLFTSLLLLSKIANRWQDHQAFTFADTLLCLSLFPSFAVFFVLVLWLGNRYITYPLAFRIDEKGLTTPVGRPLDWFRPTSCKIIRDQHVSHVYHLQILRGKLLMYDVLLDDPAKATHFIAQFHKLYGTHGMSVDTRVAQSS